MFGAWSRFCDRLGPSQNVVTYAAVIFLAAYFGEKYASQQAGAPLPDFRFGYTPSELRRWISTYVRKDGMYWFIAAEVVDTLALVPSYVALEAAGMGRLWRRSKFLAALPLIGGLADWMENACHLVCAWQGTVITEVAQLGSACCQLKWGLIGVANVFLLIGFLSGRGGGKHEATD